MDTAKAGPRELTIPLFSTSSAMVLKKVTFTIGGSEWQILTSPCLDSTTWAHLSIFGVWRENPPSVVCLPHDSALDRGGGPSPLLCCCSSVLILSGSVLRACTFKSKFWGLRLIIIICMRGKWTPPTTSTMPLFQPDSSTSLLHFYMDMQNKKISISVYNLLKTVCLFN